MNKILYACLLLSALTVFFCTHAVAAVQEFPRFTIDVPDDWTGIVDDETVVLIAKDKSAAVTINIYPAEGKSLEAIAKQCAKEFKGTSPKLENGVYVFNFKSAAVDNTAIVAGNGQEYALYIITGEHPKIRPMLESLKDR